MLAVPPQEAASIVPSLDALRIAAETAMPIHAACLDVGLSELPNPTRTFALGFGIPHYYSVHTQAARLAPPGGALIHLARYLTPNERPTQATKVELESLLELLQPGWRVRLVSEQWLPFTTVTHDFPQATRGGRAGRCPVALRPRLFAAGDWVGAEGLLSDAAFASGALAGAHAARDV